MFKRILGGLHPPHSFYSRYALIYFARLLQTIFYVYLRKGKIGYSSDKLYLVICNFLRSVRGKK